MLTKINVSIQDDPFEGGIVITSTANISTLRGITAIRFSRKKSDEWSWTTVHTVPVTFLSDLNFKLLDYLIMGGHTYSYSIDVLNGDAIVEMDIIENIPCTSDCLFIGNQSQHFLARADFKTTINRNRSVAFVETLRGKYPYMVSNSELDYVSGTTTGLFLELDDGKHSLKPDLYHEYTDRVMDFLCDGTNKILRTHDGHIYNIGIEGNPKENYSEFWGASAIEFNWREIGDVPETGMAVIK